MGEPENNRESRYNHLLWQLEYTSEFGRTLKRYQKKHREAIAQLMSNFEKVHEALNLGCKPQSLTTKHIHSESQGILAVDQRGGKGKTKELRLYIWPCTSNSTIYVLKIGEKNRQSEDIEWCKNCVTKIEEEK